MAFPASASAPTNIHSPLPLSSSSRANMNLRSVTNRTSGRECQTPPGVACTHTFDAWDTFATSYSAQNSISGKYGIDFRFAPDPSAADRRTLKMLETAAQFLGPKAFKKSAEQFDYLENAYARSQKMYPCATPRAHEYSTSATAISTQASGFLSVGQPSSFSRPQAPPISTSSSATPRASPGDERNPHHPQMQSPISSTNTQPQSLLQPQLQSYTDPLHDMFFNFDSLASPSEGSAPPDTDVEHDHGEEDTEETDSNTDFESERDLRLEDLEGPLALRPVTGRRSGRGRGGRRGRAGSMNSISTTSSGQAASPASPNAARMNVPAGLGPFISTNANAFQIQNQNIGANTITNSFLRPSYARRSTLPVSSQVLQTPQSQPQVQVLSQAQSQHHFPTSVSESGAGSSPNPRSFPGPGPSSPANANARAGAGIVGLSAAARARMRGRQPGAPRSEPGAASSLSTNAKMSTSGSGTGRIDMGHNVGPYGYRYPVLPSYPDQVQAQLQGYPNANANTTKEEMPAPVHSHSAQHTPISTSNLDASADANVSAGRHWQTPAGLSYGLGNTTTAHASPVATGGAGSSMDVDLDMGGWGRVSGPVPGMDLGYGSGTYSTVPSEYSVQSRFQHQLHHAYDSQQHTQQHQQHDGSTATIGFANGSTMYGRPELTLSSYYAVASSSMDLATACPSPAPAQSINPNLNMSPSRWKGSNANSNSSSSSAIGLTHKLGQPAAGLSLESGSTQAHGYAQRMTTSGFWPTSDLRRGGIQ